MHAIACCTVPAVPTGTGVHLSGDLSILPMRRGESFGASGAWALFVAVVVAGSGLGVAGGSAAASRLAPVTGAPLSVGAFSDLGPEAPYAVHSEAMQHLAQPVDRWQLPGFALGPQQAPPWAGKPGAPTAAALRATSVDSTAGVGLDTIAASSLYYTSARWMIQHPTNFPSPREGAAMAYDSTLGEVILFGGHSTAGNQSDTWAYRGGVWTNLTASVAGAPNPRYDSLMADDPSEGGVLLVGGYYPAGGVNFMNDTWLFNGTSWRFVARLPVPSVPNWFGVDLAADPGLGEDVFVGNDWNSCTGNCSIVWGYHAGSWTSLPSDPCGYRDPLVYDAKDGYLLSLGGNYTYNTCQLSNGGTWSYGNVAPIPNGGWGPLGYDGHAQAVVLPLSKIWPSVCPTPFSCSQTWAYNGGSWTNVTSLLAQEPSGRAGAALAYDSADGYSVFFGGGNQSTLLGDTWTLTLNTSSVVYPVTFQESGLPTGTAWSVTLQGATNSSTLSSVGFVEPNGTFAFQVAPVPGYSASVSMGNVTVQGSAPAPVVITFTSVPLSIVSFTASPNQIPLGGTTFLNVTVSGQYPPFTYSYWGLPPGCASANASSLACAPSVTGRVAVTVDVFDSASNFENSTVFFNIVPASLSIVSFTAPATEVGASVNLTVTLSGGTPPYTYSYSGLPPGCLSANLSTLPCSPSAPGGYAVSSWVNDSAGGSTVASAVLQVVPHVAYSITVYNRSSVDAGQRFYVSGAAANGVAPYDFTLTGASCWPTLPNPQSSPVVFNCTAPTGVATATLAGTLTDALGVQAQSNALALQVDPALQTTLNVSGTPVRLGSTVAFVANTTGGAPPYVYQYGGLPPGCVSVNASEVGCLPTQAGFYNATVWVSDQNGANASSTLEVEVVFDFTVIAPSTAHVGETFQLVVHASGGYGSLTYAYGGLPPGCSSADTPMLNCTPSRAGSYTVTITVRDGVGDHATHVVSLQVSASPSSRGPLGVLSEWEWVALGTALAAVLGLLLAVLVMRRRRPKSPDLRHTSSAVESLSPASAPLDASSRPPPGLVPPVLPGRSEGGDEIGTAVNDML